jgi:drug/metabolite transporter (DMT)-like permease
MSAFFGPLLVLAFTLSQSLRDVYFGAVFQGVDFFAILLLAFGLSTIIFGVMALLRAPHEFGLLRKHLRSLIAANLTTALAWSCYFFALTHVDPSVVNTIHSGMGPLTVFVLGIFGIRLAQARPGGIAEKFGYAGIAVSIAGLWWTVLSGHSGLPADHFAQSLAGVALVMVSGVSITVSLLYCKRMQDGGLSADTVTATRYFLLIAVAGGVELAHGRLGGIDTAGRLVFLSAASIVLIVLPLYVFQLGIGRTAPLTAQIIRALGPIFVFAMAQFDGRMTYSAATLICIAVYSFSVIWSNLAHGWRGDGKAPVVSPVPQRIRQARG